MEHVRCIPERFAVRDKDSDAKTRLLKAPDKLNESGVKLEKSSETFALRIATVLMVVYTLARRVEIGPEIVVTEIIRLTKCTILIS